MVPLHGSASDRLLKQAEKMQRVAARYTWRGGWMQLAGGGAMGRKRGGKSAGKGCSAPNPAGYLLWK